MNATNRHSKGFSMVVNLLALATFVTVLATLVLPWRNDTVRARVSQGITQASLAGEALTAACRGDHRKVVSDNSDAGYFFIESKYVADIRLTADCSSGILGIHVRTQNTGARPDPEIVLFSRTADPDQGHPQWRCGLASGKAEQVPEECRHPVTVG